MRCGTGRCCAVLCRAACFALPIISYIPGIIRSIIPGAGTTTVHQVVRTTLLNNKNSLPAQLSPAIAPQRSAVRCRVLLCRAVLCCAALRFLSNIQYQLSCKVPGTRYRYARVYLSFCFLLHLIVLFRSPSCFFFTNYTRTADQNVTSPTSAQHSKGQSALNK